MHQQQPVPQLAPLLPEIQPNQETAPTAATVKKFRYSDDMTEFIYFELELELM